MSTSRFDVVEDGAALRVERCRKFYFTGFSPNIESYCHIVLATKKGGEATTVVCSQPENYVGTSVTNAVEIIYRRLLAMRGRKLHIGSWFEHYPAGTGILQERYSLMEVTFDQGSPSWGPLITWTSAAQRARIPAKFLAYGYADEIK